MTTDMHVPRKWWQWILVYPTVATAFLAATPTAIEALRSNSLGVGFGDSQRALDQKDLWERNMSCAQAPYDWLETNTNTKVDATICETGDVLVRIKTPTTQGYEWVAIDKYNSTHSRFEFMKTAVAADFTKKFEISQAITVLCQEWISDSILLRRIHTQDQGCYDEIVNVYTGEVKERNPAPCTEC